MLDKLISQINALTSSDDMAAALALQALLDDEDYYQSILAGNYPDTYDVLHSLADGLNEMGNY